MAAGGDLTNLALLHSIHEAALERLSRPIEMLKNMRILLDANGEVYGGMQSNRLQNRTLCNEHLAL